MSVYDPFSRGPLPVNVRTIDALDTARGRQFPCEIWYPTVAQQSGLIIFSHASRQHRRAYTFLCNHLSSHGYVVAAMDHSEVVVPELAGKSGETAEQKAA